MPAGILHQVKLNGRLTCTLSGRIFNHSGVFFEIVGSSSIGPGVYDVVHTVKNADKGTYAEIEMVKLVEILKTADE